MKAYNKLIFGCTTTLTQHEKEKWLLHKWEMYLTLLDVY